MKFSLIAGGSLLTLSANPRFCSHTPVGFVHIVHGYPKLEKLSTGILYTLNRTIYLCSLSAHPQVSESAHLQAGIAQGREPVVMIGSKHDEANCPHTPQFSTSLGKKELLSVQQCKQHTAVHSQVLCIRLWLQLQFHVMQKHNPTYTYTPTRGYIAYIVFAPESLSRRRMTPESLMLQLTTSAFFTRAVACKTLLDSVHARLCWTLYTPRTIRPLHCSVTELPSDTHLIPGQLSHVTEAQQLPILRKHLAVLIHR